MITLIQESIDLFMEFTITRGMEVKIQHSLVKRELVSNELIIN